MWWPRKNQVSKMWRDGKGADNRNRDCFRYVVQLGNHHVPKMRRSAVTALPAMSFAKVTPERAWTAEQVVKHVAIVYTWIKRYPQHEVDGNLDVIGFLFAVGFKFGSKKPI
jgi:hypothetical protein